MLISGGSGRRRLLRRRLQIRGHTCSVSKSSKGMHRKYQKTGFSQTQILHSTKLQPMLIWNEFPLSPAIILLLRFREQKLG